MKYTGTYDEDSDYRGALLNSFQKQAFVGLVLQHSREILMK